jgi:hypothetical protein
MEVSKAKQIALQTLEHMGANKFLVMTGSKIKYHDDKGALTFSLTKNKLKAQYLKVSVNGLDLYDMVFTKVVKIYDSEMKVLGVSMVKDYKIVVIKEIKDIYFDQLQKIFTIETGLDTSLGTMGR